MDLFTPKTAAPISFGDQPNQGDVDSDEATRKKSGLEAYARRNKQSLPKDFSDQVIENEMDLEKDFVTLETVNKLTELYSLAMAFYESEGNHKYKYFANKLQDLLMKANVKEMMVRELAPSKKTKQDEQQIKRLRLENKISKINAEKEAFTVVKSQEYRDRELNKVLEKNIQSQKDRIKQKLAEKKARAASRAQSVTYLSDDNSSLPDDHIQDFEKELEDKPRLNDIAEVDEARYNTPPRKRGKDGQMVFFEKGKAQKTFKFDFDEDKKKPTKGHTRRHSFHRENVVAVIAQKRTSRAQSFGNGKAPFPIEKLKPLTDDNNKAITEKTDGEEHSAGFVRKQTKNQTIVEDCNEDKNKSVNSIESAASKNQVEEIVVQDDKEPEHTQNIESAVFLDDDDEEDHQHEEEQVIETEETHVVADEIQIVAEEENIHEQEVQDVQEVQVEEQENTQPEAEVQVQVEEQQVVEAEESQPAAEETQVVPEEENIHEQVQETQEVQVEEQENIQPKAEEEQVIQTEEENIHEQVQETQDVQVEEQENIQPEAEAEAVVSEVQQEEPVKEEEVIEAAPEQIVEEAQVNNQEEAVQESEQVQEEQAEVKEEEVQNEEPKAEIEEVKEQAEEQVKEEKNIRRRTDSEVADEKKLALMRQIDAEQKELIDAFIQKQAQEREEVTKKIEEKFEQKIQNMKEEMDEDEIAGDMWQRALKKFNKDKETEINESLEKLGQEQAPEFDKYKKKLLQQKMFKLAELSDE